MCAQNPAASSAPLASRAAASHHGWLGMLPRRGALSFAPRARGGVARSCMLGGKVKRKTNCDMLVREGVPLARTCTRPRAAGFRPQSFRLGPSASSRGGWRQGIGRKWGRAGVARRNERRVTEGVETIARPEHTLAVAPVGNLGAQRASGPGGAPPAPGTSASASACSCATSLTPLPFRPVRGRQPAHALEVARLHGALAGRVWQQRKWHAHLPQRPDGKMPQ